MKRLVQRTYVAICTVSLMTLILAGCGSGGGGGAASSPEAASQTVSGNVSSGTPSAGGSSASTQGTGTSSAIAAKQLSLAWDPVAGATSYNLYWSTAPGVTPASGNRINVDSNSYVHTGLAAGTTYYYVVTAADSGSESAASSPTSGTTAL